MKSIHKTLITLMSLGFSLSLGQISLPKNSSGWTIFTPGSQARILYVSSSMGNDTQGAIYTASSPEVGSNPFLPSTGIKPFKTYAAAYAQSRADQGDWILIRRGDTLTEGLSWRNGKSTSEPFLIASYGASVANPLLKTGSTGGLSICCKSFQNIALQGLDFYAHTRNPDSPEYVSSNGQSGFSIYVGEGFTGKNFLLEGCRFRFYSNNTVQAPGTVEGIVIRRNSFFDNYSTTAHAQGLFASGISLTLEENIFDHNGWYMQQNNGSDKTNGMATMYNHNTYFAGTHDVIFRNNIFVRSSSIQNKWTANGGVHSSRNLTIENNLYVDGEIGMSIGGNEVGPHRFQNVHVKNNVLLDIGRSQPTNRTLGWGIELKDWDSGSVVDNFFVHQVKSVITNAYALQVYGTVSHVDILRNTFHNLHSAHAMVLTGNGTKTDVEIAANRIHLTTTSDYLMQVEDGFSGYTLRNNQYFHNGRTTNAFRIGSSDVSFNQWVTQSGETGATWQALQMVEPTRSIETYQSTLGNTATIEGFAQNIRQVSFGNWDLRYSAPVINNYIRTGYLPEGPTRILSNSNINRIPYVTHHYDLLGRNSKTK